MRSELSLEGSVKIGRIEALMRAFCARLFNLMASRPRIKGPLEAGPRESSSVPLGVLREGLMGSGLWPKTAWCLVILEGGQPSSWGRNPTLPGPFSSSLGLLMFSESLKPGTDFGLNSQT